MGVNKVIGKNNEVVLDLTSDTVTPYTLATGAIAHNAAGDPIIGVGGLDVSAIDDNAGYGDYDKAWSADKTYTEITDIKRQIATGGVHNEGVWSSSQSYTQFATVTNAGSSYLALEDVPAGTSLSNTDYWQKLAESGGAENIDDTAGEGDTTVTWSADKILGASLYKNVAWFTPNGEALSSSNIASAITAALDCSKYIYIPSGSYEFHIEITKDCNILMDDDTYLIKDTNNSSMIRVRNCSFSMYGGNILSGNNTGSRTPIGGQTSIITLYDCYDCLIYNVNSPYSQSNGIFSLKNSTNVEFNSCKFDNISQIAIYFGDHCVNVSVKNCVFKNVRYMNDSNGNPYYYCYFVATGVSDMSDGTIIPVEGYVCENNYCYNSEDCGIDTHGAKNVIIRNNIILDSPCSITAYEDNFRANRPADWIMENILIENNRCINTKNSNPNSTYTHPFIFLGGQNYYSENTPNPNNYYNVPGSYDSYRNCIVRNNVFISSDNMHEGIMLNQMSKNITIENNYIDLPNKSVTIWVGHCINLLLQNNYYKSKREVRLYRSVVAEIKDKAEVYMSTAYCSYFNLVERRNTLIRGTTFAYNDIVTLKTNDSSLAFVRNHNKCVNNAFTGNKTYTITVSNGITHLPDHKFIPYLSVNISNTEYYVSDLIDIDHFVLKAYSDDTLLTDGTYTITLNEVILEQYSRIGVTDATGQVNLRDAPNDTTSTVIKQLASSTVVIVGGKYGNYYLVTVIDNGELIYGYVFYTFITFI